MAELDNESVHFIDSIEDLVDERAREIGIKYGLKIEEVFPSYISLIKELEANNYKIRIDTKNPATPLNIYYLYERKYACMALIYYEFTKSQMIGFPPQKSQTKPLNMFAFLMKQALPIIERETSAEDCEKRAKYCKEMINLFKTRNEAYLLAD
ncbi:MAG: hypothetical protein ACOYT4_02130 [Nanoarchaeota archaeon]